MMEAIEVRGPGERFAVVERSVPEPGPREVLVAVEACGVCHGDTAVTAGRAPIDYPRIPGHEVAGQIEAVGDDVTQWSVGDDVAVGWHGGHCFTCDPCQRGDFVNCERQHVTGLLGDGGYAEYVAVAREAVVPVPDGLDATSAGPLACAGLTAFNALRNADVSAGDTVAVQGIGGVGHLGVQFADAMGFETVAISRGTDKRDPALELGADHYVDATDSEVATALETTGGADAILATAPSSNAMEVAVDALGPNGRLIAVGAPEKPIELDVGQLLGSRQAIQGWSSGHAGDARDALEAAVRNDVAPWVETYGLAEVDRAFDRMVDGDVRFRAVLEP